MEECRCRWLIDGSWLKQEQSNSQISYFILFVTQSESIFHVFKGGDGDVLVLKYSFPQIPALLYYRNTVDLDMMSQSICFNKVVSLSLLVYMFWGKPLDKSQQCTDWSIRPLSSKQTIYAAADAYVSRLVFLKFWDIIEQEVIPLDVIDNLKASRSVFPPVVVAGKQLELYDLSIKVGVYRQYFENSLSAAKRCPDYRYICLLIHNFPSIGWVIKRKNPKRVIDVVCEKRIVL